MQVNNLTNNAMLSGAMGGTASTSNMGKQEFLQLLVAQLKNQDPLSPMEGQEFAAQLAQFSSLEQLSNIDNTLQYSVDMNMLLTQTVNNTLAANFIGREITAIGNTIPLKSDEESNIHFHLPGYAEKLMLTIYDEAGNLVRSIETTGLASGEQMLTWDGKSSDGRGLPEGNYTFKVKAVDTNGDQMNAIPISKGLVSGIRFVDGNPILIVNGREVSMADVLEIG